MSEHCCERFAKECGEYKSPSALAWAYPPEARPTAQIERTVDGSYNVNGCCGGGCYVLEGLRFCPWCGSALGGQ